MIEVRKFCVFIPQILTEYLWKVVLDGMNLFPNTLCTNFEFQEKNPHKFYYTDVIISDSNSAHNLTYFTFQGWLACL